MGAEASKPMGQPSQRRASKEDIQALEAVGAYTDPMVPVGDYVTELVRVAHTCPHVSPRLSNNHSTLPPPLPIRARHSHTHIRMFVCVNVMFLHDSTHRVYEYTRFIVL